MRSIDGTFTEQARRRQIVTAAIAVIAETGYARSSIAKIADHAGMAKSVVLYHFKTKDDIIEAVAAAVFAAAAEQMVPAMSAASSAADRLAAYIRSNIAFIDRNRVEATAMLEIVTAYRSPDGLRFDQVAAAATPAQGAGLEALDPAAIFVDGVDGGEFRSMSAAFMKNAVRAALDGAVWELARDPGYDIVGYGEELVTIFDLATRSR